MEHKKREQILQALHRRVEKKEPILICEAGIGAVAKMAEAAGIDLIVISGVGRMRMNGMDDAAAYRPCGNCNDFTKDIAIRIRKIVKHTPVIAGIGPSDPYRDIEEFEQELFHMGISGVINLPSVGPYTKTYRANIDKKGLGIPLEAEMLKRNRGRGIFTIANSFYDEDAELFAAAGADMICINHRFAVEEKTNRELYQDTERCCAMVQQTVEKVKRINPDILTVVHGGTFDSLEKNRILFASTDADGFFGSGYFDEKPMREGIGKTLKDFAELEMG